MFQSVPRRLSTLILVLSVASIYPLLGAPANVGPVRSAARPVVVPTYPAVEFEPKVLDVQLDFSGFGFGFQPIVMPGSFGGRSSIYRMPQIRGQPNITASIAGFAGPSGSFHGFGRCQPGGRVDCGNVGQNGFAAFGVQPANFTKGGFCGNNGL